MRRWRRYRLAAVLAAEMVALAAASSARAQARFDPDRYPGGRFGSDAAVATVDRFIAALNRRDTVALAALFDPDAAVYGFDNRSAAFEERRWLPRPWQYHLTEILTSIQSGAAGPRATFRGDARFTVLGRVASGSFVTERERLRYRRPGGYASRETGLVTYHVRGSRIHRIFFVSGELDPVSVPQVQSPTHPVGTGPIVAMDVGHRNFNTPGESYLPFAELLRRDGYRVRTFDAPFTDPRLDSVKVLVISDALPGPHRKPGVGPGAGPSGDAGAGPTADVGSAFTPQEIVALRSWVSGGGALVLIADHAPWAGAASALAKAFGAAFHDGRVVHRRAGPGPKGNFLFTRGNGTLHPHPITDGLDGGVRIDSVATFLGQAFPPADSLQPLLVLPDDAVLISSSSSAPRPVGGWLQGAVRRFGQGSVALFGEAWMFRFLENHMPGYRPNQNAPFILNLFRWLTRSGPASRASDGGAGSGFHEPR